MVQRGTTVEIQKRPSVTFPNLCPRCLRPAERRIEVRHASYGSLAIRVKKVRVPICNTCYREIMPRHFAVSFVLGWGFVALGVSLISRFPGAWGGVGFFLSLLASRAAKDYNPFGVSFSEGRKSYTWIFPRCEYAQLFRAVNDGG